MRELRFIGDGRSNDSMCTILEHLDTLPDIHTRQFSVGGVAVEIAGGRGSDVVLTPGLEEFQCNLAAPAVRIQVDWARNLQPSRGRRLFDAGNTWQLYEVGSGFQFDFFTVVFGQRPFKRLLINKRFSAGFLHKSEECLLGFEAPVNSLGYPLDELLIMHRLTQEKAIELHGTGIVRPTGDANLFVGHSGAGKSTTTRLWTALEDVEVLSDDRIIVRRDESAVEAPSGGAGGASKHGVLRLREKCASCAFRSAQDDSAIVAQDDNAEQARNKYSMRMYGTPWHGEAMYASPNSAPLTRIFVLEHGLGNVITPLTPSQAVAELFARAFVPFHRHEYVESALTFLEEVVDSVPVYRYAFEPDERAVEKIIHFHD